MKQEILDYFGNNYTRFYEKYLTNIKPLKGNEYQALCPLHDDSKPSFNFNSQTGKYFCHGCKKSGDIFGFYAELNSLDDKADFQKILAGIASDFGITCEKKKSEIVKTYDYTDAEWNLFYQVCRMQPKGFKQRRPDGKGGYIWDLKGVKPLLYHLPEVIKSDQVIVVEGEKDADNLMNLGFTATCNSGGAGKWRPEYSEYLKDKDITLIPDNDEPGRAHMKNIAASLDGKAKSIKWFKLPGIPEKGDVSDFIETFGDDTAAAGERIALMIDGTQEYVMPGYSFSAGELMKRIIPETVWAVPGILPEGCGVLAGKPKMGKSIAAMNLAIAIANGGKVFGKIPVKQGPVLYLALEDTQRRLQQRIKQMVELDSVPYNLHISTEWPRMGEGGITQLESEIKRIKGLRLVIIDTLKMIRPVEKDRNKGLYDRDYEPIARLKMIADKYNVSILIIHHLRKSASEDVFDTMSGSLGLTGATDTNLILERKSGNADATLHINGRDVEPQEYALKFEPSLLSWNLIGKASEVKSTETIQKVYDAFKMNNAPMSPKLIADETGLKLPYIKKLLPRLISSGDITKLDRGLYQYIDKGTTYNNKGTMGIMGTKGIMGTMGTMGTLRGEL